MEDEPALERIVRELLSSQRLAVLSTETGGAPYSSLIAFAASPDISTLVFTTARPTRKFSNLSENERVSLLVENRTNREEDFARFSIVTSGEVGGRRRGEQGRPSGPHSEGQSWQAVNPYRIFERMLRFVPSLCPTSDKVEPNTRLNRTRFSRLRLLSRAG